MVKCDICDDELEYLPFKCRYCGGQYCKKHRLPENHQCSYKYKNDPYVVKSIVPSAMTNYRSYTEESSYEDNSMKKNNIFGRGNSNSRAGFQSLFAKNPQMRATYSIMIAQLVIYLITLIPGVANYVYIAGVNWYYVWTYFTAAFAPNNLIDLIFNLLIIYFMGRTLESRFGSKTMFWVYTISGLLTSVVFVGLEFILSLIPTFGEEILQVSLGMTAGSMLGLISFLVLLLPNTQVNILLFFFPVKLKTKNLIWYIVGFYLIIGIIDIIIYFTSGNQQYLTFVLDFASVFGALGGYLKIRQMRKEAMF